MAKNTKIVDLKTKTIPKKESVYSTMSVEQLRGELRLLKKEAKGIPAHADNCISLARQICKEMIKRIQLYSDNLDSWRQ